MDASHALFVRDATPDALQFPAMPTKVAKAVKKHQVKKAAPPSTIVIPAPTPVRMPAGYVPKGTKPKFLSWKWVTERLERSHNYWICTTRADGRPHVMPVWGVYVDDAVVFSTDPSSLKARNMRRSPAITIHLESGEEVVILQGNVEKVALRKSIDDAYHAKYKIRMSSIPGPTGIYELKPKVVMAWREKDFVESSTRWQF